MTALQNNKRAILGLNHGASVSESYTDINYAMYFMSGKLQVYENGRTMGTYGIYVANSVGQVRIGTSGKVQYVLDGEIRYTSSQVPQFPLFVDVSFYDSGASFNTIKWVGDMAADAKIAVGQPVQFTSFKGVGASGPGELQKLTGFAAGWNAGAESKYKFEKADINKISGVSVQVPQTNKYTSIGLNPASASQNYQDIDFAFWLMPNAQVRVYESGGYKGTFGVYEANSVVVVRINAAGKVEYVVDGSLRYTSTKIPTFPLGVDSSFNTAEGKLAKISWVGGA